MRPPRFAFFLLASVLSAASGVAAAQTLLPHRAVYDLALSEASDESDIDAMNGRWVFEFAGSECEGYTLKSRIVMRFDMADGPRLIDQRVTSFEDPKGETFRFVTKSFVDENLESEVAGTARREEDGTVIAYDEPEETERRFAPVLFPTGQLRELLDKARAGENFYESAIFDGTEFAEQPVMISVVVGRPKPVESDDPERKVLGDLAEDTFMPVTAAYFDGSAKDGEEISDYNVSFKLHESGVQRDMLIRYPDYSMTAKLVNLDLQAEQEACETENAR
ncbi:cell envelope integrity EipB family protein [Nitratireductor sp. GCM10026969]|uniref:cell envelope integrity EipB family protein n=1 Tax=Nitratireductor sp. GCM10026969 TaxID=3252645 RepID=UPI00361A7D29